MTDLKLTVALTSVNGENMSRHDMLQWVNDMVQGQFKKIEELCSGSAYCQMMEMIFPNCINLKRVKMSAKLEHEYLHNLKLFQGAFNRLKLDKTVPIDRLIKGRFQDNFEFLQWFKKFFDSQAPGLENIKSMANAPVAKPIKPRVFAKAEEPLAVKEPTTPEHEAEDDNNKALKELMEERQTMNLKSDRMVEERDQCYNKLRLIEDLLDDMINNNQEVEFCKRVQVVLYKTMDSQNQEEVGEPKEEVPNEGLY
ncbi:microtubule-associated protein RP/EB family member 1 [Drosophila bipectinata]|uniref:microtubule-associated protein RP/EB family member 1 n=1 Tax=Drosophila bipectinata TaxID=42026 RepID=UPI001C8A02E4|nr:microtubule-associated protein RP/EB family member 1 [Drosophila bipectinata]